MLSQRHCDTVLGGQDGTRPSNISNAHKQNKSIQKPLAWVQHQHQVLHIEPSNDHLTQTVALHGPNRNAASCLCSCLPLDAWSRSRQLHSSALCSIHRSTPLQPSFGTGPDFPKACGLNKLNINHQSQLSDQRMVSQCFPCFRWYPMIFPRSSKPKPHLV